MEEVDAEPVELGPELRDGVQPGLGCPPVVFVRPVAANVLDVFEGDSLGPVVDGFAFRPTGATQAVSQVLEVGLGDLDSKR